VEASSYKEDISVLYAKQIEELKRKKEDAQKLADNMKVAAYDVEMRILESLLAHYVIKPDRRQGIGGQLLERVVQLPRREIVVSVDERNLDAQLFLRSQGFRAVAIERNHYIFKRGKVGVATEVQSSLQTVGASQ